LVEKEVMKCDFGMAVTCDGSVIRMTMSVMSGDVRNSLIKKVGVFVEECKVGFRNCRRESIECIRKEVKGKKVGRDEGKDWERKIEEVVERGLKEVEKVGGGKRKELEK
jgi:ribosome recycling factor